MLDVMPYGGFRACHCPSSLLRLLQDPGLHNPPIWGEGFCLAVSRVKSLIWIRCGSLLDLAEVQAGNEAVQQSLRDKQQTSVAIAFPVACWCLHKGCFITHSCHAGSKLAWCLSLSGVQARQRCSSF